MTTHRKLTAALALAAFVFCLRPAEGASSDSFRSGGRPVAIERFDPANSDRRARTAVLLLHGSDGPGPYRDLARRLAAHFRVFLLHYLDRTGERAATRASIRRHTDSWVETVRDAVTWVSKRPDVDAAHVAVLGVSFGGGLALAAASRDRRIRAVASWSGWVPPAVLGAKTLPPVLILHGTADRVVPFADAQGLDRLLRARGVPHELAAYDGQGHKFTGQARTDAEQRIAAFLGRHLASRP